MSDNRPKILSDLDFDTIKSNLSTFIANNSDFTDWQYEGSVLSFITDILSYNTHYNAVYLNMALNESFIDTAQTRSSIVSLAKSFGYTPKSSKSPLSKISFTINEPDLTKINGNTIFLNRSNYFTTDVSGKTYIYSPVEVTSATSNNGVYTFNDILIREGALVTKRFTVVGGPRESFTIPSNIDLDTLRVTIQNSETDTSVTTYNLISDIITLNPESLIFYLFETTLGKYEITFGDGVLGKKPNPGSIVNVEFGLSTGPESNGASDFSLSSAIDARFSDSDITFTNIVPSYGGAESEDIDSIRINALQSFRTQGRAVTAEDYKFFIGRDYPLAQTISVWGGQDADPPQYGKVFISFKPANGFFLSNAAKQTVLESIKSKNIVSILPEIVDPEYLYLIIDTTVKFDPRSTNLTAGGISNLVLEKIKTFNNTTLTAFGNTFDYSKFSTMIDSVHPSIQNNITTIKMRKSTPVILNKSLEYLIDFQNPIHPGSLGSSRAFRCETNPLIGNPTEDLFIEDNKEGVVQIFKLVGPNFSEKVIVAPRAGTIDYATGKVRLTNFNPSRVNSDNTLDLVVRPQEFSIGNIRSLRNTIITILDTEIRINVVN